MRRPPTEYSARPFGSILATGQGVAVDGRTALHPWYHSEPWTAGIRSATCHSARGLQGVEMPSKDNKRSARPTFTDQEALQFHSQGRPGKLEVVATKPMATQRDLSLAYSPGVAVPVLAI